MATNNALIMFTSFQSFIESEQETKELIRNAVRELEQKQREMVAVIQGVHHKASKDNINILCQNVRSKFPSVIADFHRLIDKIPVGQYYRYHDHWRLVLQQFVFLVAFITYLEKEELVSREEAAASLDLKTDWSAGFHLDLDDYLIGVLNLASELSRLSVNCVIAGDYETPKKIGNFMSDLDAAFRLLNLKNDGVRKRFDGLKYDLKKVEEVVYDLQIRGLKSNLS